MIASKMSFRKLFSAWIILVLPAITGLAVQQDCVRLFFCFYAGTTEICFETGSAGQHHDGHQEHSSCIAAADLSCGFSDCCRNCDDIPLSPFRAAMNMLPTAVFVFSALGMLECDYFCNDPGMLNRPHRLRADMMSPGQGSPPESSGILTSLLIS